MLTRYHTDSPLPYLLYLPDDYDPGQPYPLLMFLHGIGDRGKDLDFVRRDGLPEEIDNGRELPCIVVAPQCPDNRYWTKQAQRLKSVLDEVQRNHQVDPSRIYLTGLSMGGYGAWVLGLTYPDLFAAIVPICGGGAPEYACNLKDVPVWAFHGADDPVVPLIETQNMVDALEACGGNVRLTIYPGVDHDSWTQTYADPDLYEWLFAQKKQTKG